MKQLSDYRWLCSTWKIKNVIVDEMSWEQVSRRPLIEGFITQLVGTALLSLQSKTKITDKVSNETKTYG